MFMDSMNVLQDASSTLNNTVVQFIDVSERVSNLETLVLSTETSLDLSSRILSLEQTIAANQALFNNTQAIMGLINQNYDLVRALINNQTSIEVSYNLDLLKQGTGILLDRSVPNEVTVKNSNQDFTIGANSGKGTLTQAGSNEINLLEFSNYFKHVNNGNPITLTQDMTIRIKDTNKWKTGQRFRLSFGDPIYPGNFLIKVLTDSQGLYPVSSPSGIAYSNNIITLDDTILSGQSYIPVLDIVCIDDQNLKFQVDIIGKSLTNNN